MRRSLAALAFLSLTGCVHPADPTLPPAPPPALASFDVGSLHVDEYGRGDDAVVLLPGLGAGPWEWYGVIAHLAPAHRVYVVTLPGFDGRAPAARPGHVFSTASRALLDLIARERLPRPVLIGHDLGATIALAFAIDDPRAARGVVVVDGVPVSPPLAGLGSAELHRQADYAAVAETRDPEMIRPMALQNVATTGAVDPKTTDAILDRQASADNTALAIALREMLETDLRPDLGRIVVPVLVLVPYYLPDNSTPPDVRPPVVHTQAQKVDEYRALYANAKTATLAPIAPARHFAMLDAPAAFDADVDAFLAAHP